jgi:hypothetical protein
MTAQPASRASRLTTVALAAALLAAPTVLAACSSSSSSGTTTTAAKTGTTGAGTGSGKVTPTALSCSLAPAPLVGSALGIPVGMPAPDTNGPVTVCTYMATSGGGQVIVRFQTGMTPSSFASNEAQFTANGETTTPVSGLGDEAYSSTTGGGAGTPEVNTLVVLKGSTEVLVTAPTAPGAVRSLVEQLLPDL